MKIIKDEKLLKEYIEANNFNSFFDRNISEGVQLLYYESDEYLIHYGSISKYLLFLVDGECRFFTIAGDGAYVPFGFADSFEVFGEVSCLWNLPPNSDVQAIKPTYCLGIDLNKYREILLHDVTFLNYICRLLADRLVISNKSLTLFVGAKAENRLASYIIQNSERNIFNVKLTKCYEVIGISYRHLLRLMDLFCKQKLLKKQNGKYLITNRKRLNELAFMSNK